MNLTISVDDATLERARALARRRGISLQELLRQMIESVAGNRTAHDTADELLGLWRQAPGRSDGTPIVRGDAYEGRV